MKHAPLKDSNINTFNNDSDEIDIGKLFRFVLIQSKLVILITVLGFMAALANNFLSTKQFSIQSLLQYESVNQNIFDPASSLQSSFNGSNTDISNLVTLYESRTNILKLIKDLKLNIDFNGLLDNENIDINIESKSKNKLLTHNLNFSFSNNGYTLLDKNQNELAFSNYGEYIYFNELEILINSSNIPNSKIVKVDYRNPESMYNQIKSRINISSEASRNAFVRNGGLLTVTFIADDPDFGKKVVNYANEIFLNQRITVETEKSRKALDFINKNLKSLKNDFENKKSKLNRFREKNQSLDVNLEIQSILKKIEDVDRAANSIDLAIAQAREVYTENNIALSNLLNEKKIIEKQKEEIVSLTKIMPKEQQEYIDLYNDVQVAQNLFAELESRRLSLSILEASTIGDIRVVDEAYLVAQVSPKFSSVILFTFFSMLVGFTVAVIRGFLVLPISNPAELFDNNIHIPVIGVVPYINDTQSEKDSNLNSSIESLIVSIDSMKDSQIKNNIIAITSPSPGNGKSTISIKLAEGYAALGKKVLLIDGDFKRGKLGKSFNKKSIDREGFISINEKNIENFAINKNLYLIPRVRNLHNSFEFTYDIQFQQKIDFFEDYFDYIIFDTAPILSVTDTSILLEKSNFNILIIRHAVNRINDIKQAVDQFKQIGKNINGIVYNAYEKPKSNYGYYGLYGNYLYKYYSEKYLDEAYDYKK